MVWCDRSYYKEYTCEIWQFYLLLSISYELMFLSTDEDEDDEAMTIVI